MNCDKCGKETFTIRGVCADCAPVLHREHERDLAQYEQIVSAPTVEAATALAQSMTWRYPVTAEEVADEWRWAEAGRRVNAIADVGRQMVSSPDDWERIIRQPYG